VLALSPITTTPKDAGDAGITRKQYKNSRKTAEHNTNHRDNTIMWSTHLEQSVKLDPEGTSNWLHLPGSSKITCQGKQAVQNIPVIHK